MSFFLLGEHLANNKAAAIAYLGLLVINLLAILYMIFWDKRTPQKILLWVVTMICFPIIGLIFFIFLGSGPSIGKRRKFLRKFNSDTKYREELYRQSNFIDQFSTIDSIDAKNLIQFNILQNHSICTFFNDVRIYTDINEQFDDMYREIEAAAESVNFEYFIIKPDAIGRRFRDLLTQKAKEGVTVRVMYDDFGSIKMTRYFFRDLKKAGGTVCRFMPSLLRFFSRNMNYRNHRKVVVIDRKIAYTGGANIAVDYIGGHRRITPWRDTQIRVVGEAVDLLNMSFMQDYNFATGKELVEPPQTVAATERLLPMQIVTDGPDKAENGIEEAYIKAIYAAKKRIFIQTPYLVPTSGILNALKTAAHSGVDVRVMLPKVPDKPLPYNCTTAYAKELVESGIKVYWWRGFIHSKTLLIDDDISSIGTVNLDYRSFMLHFELTAFIYDTAFAEEMLNIFERDMQDSVLYDALAIAKRGPIKRLLERLMRLLAPLF